MIQHHMHQIMEHQRVVNEYRNMMNEGWDLIPLESNIFKTDPVTISQIMHMIDVDTNWYQKTFEMVLAELWRNHDKAVTE